MGLGHALMKILATIALFIFALAFGYSIKSLPAPIPSVSIYEEEDLSGSPYDEPISTLTFQYSKGSVCYANDKSGQDQRQMYVDCNAALNAGAKIGAYK